MIFLSVITLANPWIWKIAGSNLFLFILLLATTLLLHLSIYSKKYYPALAIAFVVIISFQWKTTTFQSLILLDNDEQRIRSLRLEFYKPGIHYVRVIFYKLNLKEFLEGDFTTAINRLQRNFFETVDPNVYFFGGHPRERVWANDFEKFNFIFLFPFFIGIYKFITQRKWFVFIIFGICAGVLTYIGHKSLLGPFILFPVFAAAITYGTTAIFKKTDV